MEDIFRLSDFGYEHLTELTLDGLLTRLSETTWVRTGAVLGPEERMSALAAQLPARLVVSHATAWWVHVGLGRAPSPLTLTTHPRRRVLETTGLVVHELSLARGDWETIAGHPVTTPVRTLYDLLLPLVRDPRRASGPQIAALIDDVPGDMVRRLRLYLAEVGRRPYAAQMRQVVDHFTRPGRAPGVRAATVLRPGEETQPPEMR